MRPTFRNAFFIFFLLLVSSQGFTQSLDQAKIMYSEGDYEGAKPAFEKLVKQSPNNSSYSQWYGVCCYETGDLVSAEKYLLEANKRKVMGSYLYLARLYTDIYRFDKAIEMWEGYIELQHKTKDDVTESTLKLDQVRNLLRMQEKTEDVQIIDSVVVNKNAFLNAYSLSEESGSLTTYNNFFGQGKNIASVVYTNQKGDKIYYAHPSANGRYSIFSQTKLLDAWGDEKILLPEIDQDNNYPFVMSDGITMYFASNSAESIGGYDIFVTRYNTNSNSYLTPEQMGMPFNSPSNDYMMVIDESKGTGWFVSDRNQPDDKVCIYLFIPDPSRKRIDAIEDPDERIRRALLVSIRDTWKDGADYSELIKLAYTDMTNKEVRKEHDFEFVINDNTVYFTLDEIKSDEARKLYSEVVDINKQIESLNSKLEEIRASYSNGSSSARKQISNAILNAEEQLYDLRNKSREQEKKARNAENRRTGVKY
ncbi:MAG: tetratricopeptide repeat protein [Tannerella sp.]|nr:tetratricopeptide repeat protein [Tannerella sp.]